MGLLRIKYVPAILWAICILLATNNYNFKSLLLEQKIEFNFILFPDLSDFFITYDIYLDSKIYVFQKIGHAISFGILFILLDKSLVHRKKALLLSGIFAFSTEVLQLFFERDGRLSDVIIDMAGVYLAYRLMNRMERLGGLKSVIRGLISAFVSGK